MPETTTPPQERPKGPLDELLAALKPSNATSVGLALKHIPAKKQSENDTKILAKLENGLEIFMKARTALRDLKDKPDKPPVYSLEKVELVPAGYDKKTLEAIDKATEWLVKTADAMNNALDATKPDFKLLDEVIGKAGSK